jgi:hypothetical protein
MRHDRPHPEPYALPAGALGAYAVSRTGERLDAGVTRSQATWNLAGVGRVEVFIDVGSQTCPLIFPGDATLATWEAGIPTYGGVVDLGTLSRS